MPSLSTKTQLSSFIKTVIQLFIIFFLLGLSYIVYSILSIVSETRLFIYTATVFVILFIYLYFYRKKTFSINHIVSSIFSFWLLYFCISALYSTSPFLQRLEFLANHSHWVKTDAIIVGHNSFITPRFTGESSLSKLYRNYSVYSVIMYFYTDSTDDKTMSQDPDIYSYSTKTAFYRHWTKAPKYERQRSEALVSKAIETQSYSLYINPDNPRLNQFFLSNRLFSLHESAILEFLPWILIILSLLVIINFSAIKRRILFK